MRPPLAVSGNCPTPVLAAPTVPHGAVRIRRAHCVCSMHERCGNRQRRSAKWALDAAERRLGGPWGGAAGIVIGGGLGFFFGKEGAEWLTTPIELPDSWYTEPLGSKPLKKL
jgi:hypothetical protein